ncbi:hypothetical protein LTR37_012750 [Vermiconidia calcicola]|uniref:Uncharacterized protein n=1 Tax=Vermiconidia calcicola TaxID=1690605 RepID=A0ACC3MY96_9PEZI|nr:hypothetical protein LTR37_012750 [Vermiconidia calcicola]
MDSYTDSCTTAPPACKVHAEKMEPNVSEAGASMDDVQLEDDCMDDIQNENECMKADLPKYELRPQTQGTRATFPSTWIDHDDTGNYGERKSSKEYRKIRLRRDRVKLRKATEAGFVIDTGDENEADDEALQRSIPKLMVTLSFSGEAGTAKFEELITKLPTTTGAQRQETCNGPRLRKRSAAKVSRYYSECNLDRSGLASDFPDDWTGHPAARGCWECLSLGIRCTLLDNERAWPCYACQEDDHECELIRPPALKRACERCKRRRMGCSYTSTADHGEACQQCMEDGHRCVAGPAKDPVNERARPDRDWKNDALSKKWTPKIRKHNDESPVDSVCSPSSPVSGYDGHHLPNKKSLAPLHTLQKQSNDLAHTTGQYDHPPKVTASSKVTRGTKTDASSTRITTKFCHPIAFNHEDNIGAHEPCHFCVEPGYSIFGLGTKEVQVIEAEGGTGFEEISGGHQDDGVQNTKICSSCTLARLQIVMCEQHELKPTAGKEKDLLYMNTALTELLSGSPKANRKWCTICPSLAQYECCTPSDGCQGCGLLLCETCTIALAGLYDGDLQNMLPELKDEPTKERMFGLRADYELLRQDGLLMRFILSSNQ